MDFFQMFNQRLNMGVNPEQIAREFKNHTIIVRIEGHLTMCRMGICYDIWDCTGEIADVFWIVE